MNAMNMPGFSAEASLYKTSGSYRLSAGQANYAGPQMALPQLANKHCRPFLHALFDAVDRGDDAWASYWLGAWEGCSNFEAG